MNIPGRRWLVPGVPFLFSLALSASTVSGRAYWQDSGFFLSAVKELGVLYPPGFVLYVVLAKAWSVAFFFMDFTLAVHLFSSFCAASAAAALALAARDALRSGGPFLGLGRDDADGLCGWAGALAGSLAAGGYTFWFSGLYAKPYALLTLLLSLLLWRMVRADEDRRPLDFTVVAVLIGLAWQAHPSATGAGAALLLFVAWHLKVLGIRGVLWRTVLAAAVAGAPVLLLPWWASRDPALVFGDPRSPAALLEYAAGRRFTGQEGAFGFEASRWEAALRFLWQDLKLVTPVLAGAGLIRLWSLNRRLLALLSAWAVPYGAMVLLFRLEGQLDHWLVGAGLPLFVAAAVGALEVGRRAARWARPALAALGLWGSTWAVAANYGDLSQRGYDLPEIFGRMHLEPLEPGAVFVSSSDDSSSLTQYLQIVRGVRPDILVVRTSHLRDPRTGGLSWYDRWLMRRNPALRAPDYAGMDARFPAPSLAAARSVAAFADGIVESGRTVYFERPIPPSMVREGWEIVPAGPLMKMAPRGRPIDLRHWEAPLAPESVRERYRRARCRWLDPNAPQNRLRFEPFERRLFILLVRARLLLAELHYGGRSYDRCVPLYSSILQLDPETEGLLEVVFPLGASLARLGRSEEAERHLRRALELGPPAAVAAEAWMHLGDLRISQGKDDQGRECFRQALAIPGLDPGLRAELLRRLGPR